MKKTFFSISNIFKYLFFIIAMLTFKNINDIPLAFALMVALLYLDFNFIIIIPTYILLRITHFTPINLFSAVFEPVIIFLILLIYKTKNAKPKFEMVFFILLSLTPYLFFEMTEKTLWTILISFSVLLMLSFISILAIRAVFVRGLTFKPSVDEIISISIFVCVFGYAICGLSLNFWKLISIYFILVGGYIFKGGTSATIGVILAIPIAIITNNFAYVGAFALFSLSNISFKGLNRLVSCIALVLIEIILSYYFNIYKQFTYESLLYPVIACGLFLLTPVYVFKSLCENFYIFKDKKLSRHAINRNRNLLAGKLYEVSGIFKEIEHVFLGLKKKDIEEDEIIEKLTFETYEKVCKNCQQYRSCAKKSKISEDDVDRVLRVGVSKGRITLIDLPREITSICSYPNNFILGINRLLSEFKHQILVNSNLDTGRMLLSSQAKGVSDILKGLAKDISSTLSYNTDLENKLATHLATNGIMPIEVLIYGENNELSTSVLLSPQDAYRKNLSVLVSEALNKKMIASEKSVINSGSVCVFFKPLPKYDAVFGASGRTKDNSEVCGDTHCLIRIKEDKFMIALSDGMGSGVAAKAVSESAISLIENFYKSMLPSELILSTVNKILSINAEDTYSAIDICIIDLNTLKCDFIKIGSPYGFIKTLDGIKIIEGNSLPLGILEEMKPTIHSCYLKCGEIIIMNTDGITGAFTSTTEMVEFLAKLPRGNPQSLSDELLSKALSLYNNKAEDDMTVLTLRIFERDFA